MQQGRMRPKLKMVTINHIKHKPVGTFWELYQPAQEKMMMRSWTVTHQEYHPL